MVTLFQISIVFTAKNLSTTTTTRNPDTGGLAGMIFSTA